MNLKQILLPISFLIFATSCAKVANSQTELSSKTSSSTEQPSAVEQPLEVVSPTAKICSKLDLTGIKWPAEIGSGNWSTHFALALNLTGSFEGREGWKNITGNFDGQGMSLGLMQQNFGQGSLQPLLIKMFKQDNASLARNFVNADYLSLKVMLEDWQNGAISIPNVKSKVNPNELFPEVQALNDLDTNPHKFASPLAAAQNNVSVDWAKNKILSGTNIIARWKTAFQNTSVSAAYRTLQVEAGTAMFLKAKKYKETFKFTELRSLLVMYDIVVQNGGFTATHLTIFNNWLAKNPKATEQARLLALLDARLTTVNPTYVEDVRARKSSIIYGLGNVHGSARNYPKEFCYSPLISI
ncbi:MAG: hypothetical protein H7328_04445 [Bdellovibrio sp.]|nr:hypothetical protein [Bdellovibrio sp.]